MDKWFEDILLHPFGALCRWCRQCLLRLMWNNTDPLLSDGFKCIKSETLRAAPSTWATSEKTDIYYGKEKTSVWKIQVRTLQKCQGFSFFFLLRAIFFVRSPFFVNKVVLSQACLYELCWIEHESMLLAYHGNALAPSRSPLCPPNKRRLNPQTLSAKSKQVYRPTFFSYQESNTRRIWSHLSNSPQWNMTKNVGFKQVRFSSSSNLVVLQQLIVSVLLLNLNLRSLGFFFVFFIFFCT